MNTGVIHLWCNEKWLIFIKCNHVQAPSYTDEQLMVFNETRTILVHPMYFNLQMRWVYNESMLEIELFTPRTDMLHLCIPVQCIYLYLDILANESVHFWKWYPRKDFYNWNVWMHFLTWHWLLKTVIFLLSPWNSYMVYCRSFWVYDHILNNVSKRWDITTAICFPVSIRSFAVKKARLDSDKLWVNSLISLYTIIYNLSGRIPYRQVQLRVFWEAL